MTTWLWAPGLALALLMVAACGGSSDPETSACGPVETLVDGAPIHVVDAAAVEYRFHPPTSGPHLVPAPLGGVYDEAIPEPFQVAALEVGRVVLQYAEAVEAAPLEALADASVIVAPAVVIDQGAPVAFTAWAHRQLCSGPSVADATAFIAEFAGGGPGH